MPKQCKCVGCTNKVFSNDYCKFHQHLRTDKKWLEAVQAARNRSRVAVAAKKTFKPATRKAYKIPKASAKRKEVNKVYYKNFRIWKVENPACKLRIAGVCTGFTQCPHHVYGKRTLELLLDLRRCLPSCFACNGWVEDNSAAAEELGLKRPDYNSKLTGVQKKT